jgi:hypothetical protein
VRNPSTKKKRGGIEREREREREREIGLGLGLRERERELQTLIAFWRFSSSWTRERERDDELMDVVGGVGGGVLDSCCNSVRGMPDEQIVVV